jgi:hypothetical protein
MLDWLIVLVLLALAVCPPAPPPLLAAVAGIVAMAVTTRFCARMARAKSDVPARFARDTAQIGQSSPPDGSCYDDCAGRTGRAGGQAATVAGAVAIVSDVRTVGVGAAA